jgi:hypothetical protein
MGMLNRRVALLACPPVLNATWPQYRSIKGKLIINTVAPASRRCNGTHGTASTCVTPARRRCHWILLGVVLGSTVLDLAVLSRTG